MKTYSIISDFFRQSNGKDLSYHKLAMLTKVMRDNRINFIGQQEDPGGTPIFVFRAERNNFLGFVYDLIYDHGMLGEDLLEDFDGSFEAKWLEGGVA